MPVSRHSERKRTFTPIDRRNPTRGITRVTLHNKKCSQGEVRPHTHLYTLVCEVRQVHYLRYQGLSEVRPHPNLCPLVWEVRQVHCLRAHQQQKQAQPAPRQQVMLPAGEALLKASSCTDTWGRRCASFEGMLLHMMSSSIPSTTYRAYETRK